MHRGQALAAWGFALQCVGASGCAPSDAGTRTAAPVGAQTPLPTPPTVEAGLESGTDAASQLAVPRLDDVVDAGWPAFLLQPPTYRAAPAPPEVPEPLPTTINEAVDRLIKSLPPERRERIRRSNWSWDLWGDRGALDGGYLDPIIWRFQLRPVRGGQAVNPLRDAIVALGVTQPFDMAELIGRLAQKKLANIKTSARAEADNVRRNSRKEAP